MNKIIKEYSVDYCHSLEFAYGEGMMSEGGTDGVEHLFMDIDIKNKKILDIGCGLGGAAFYLAQKYNAKVAGIDINPWLITEASKKTPIHLQQLISFHCYENDIPFADETFDAVYSKGVLCHVENKKPLFDEIHRVLKPPGQLIILDWLSPAKNKWSGRMQHMCEVDGLTLFAETTEGYVHTLQQAGFQNITIENNNELYANYNRQITNNLQTDSVRVKFIAAYNETEWQNAINSYMLIAEAIENNELLIRKFNGTIY